MRYFGPSLSLSIWALFASAVSSFAADRLTIATGPVDGVYYAAGKAICQAVTTEDPTTSCSVVASSGSVDNLLKLNSATVQLAFVQSDVQFAAYSGTGLFAATGSDKSLRSVMSLHDEAFTVLVRKDDPAQIVGHLRSRRFSAGNIGSGSRETTETLLGLAGWSATDRAGITDLPIGSMGDALCGGKIEAAIFLIGQPSPSVATPTEKCPVRILSFAQTGVDALVKARPYYTPVRIPAGTYPSISTPVVTIGVRATLVTRASVPERVITRVVASTLKHVETLTTSVPALRSWRVEEIGSVGLTAALHPGALSALKSAKLPTTTGPIAGAAASVSGRQVMPTAFDLQPLLLDAAPANNAIGTTQGTSPTGTSSPAVKSTPIGPAGRWQLQTGDIQPAAPSFHDVDDAPDAANLLQLKRAPQK